MKNRVIKFENLGRDLNYDWKNNKKYELDNFIVKYVKRFYKLEIENMN